MATDREHAKQSASAEEEVDPELREALGSATQYHVDLLKETNEHAQKMARGERGVFGNLLGGAEHAPTVIAFVAMIAGLALGLWCLQRAANHHADADFWAKQSERAFAFAGTALGFIFGRGSAKS